MNPTNETSKLSSSSQWTLPALTIGALLTLLVGLNLPIMRIQQLVFWKEDFTIMHGVSALLKEGSYFLGSILFLFSICFPVLKLSGLLYIWFKPLTESQRNLVLEWLSRLSKWSMLDVFVIAILIVISKSGLGFKIEPRIGLYLFTIAVVASSLLTSQYSKEVGRSR